MRFETTPLDGVWTIELEQYVDDRGSFARTYCDEEFRAHGLPTHYPQCNLSMNSRAGTLRGMHYNVHAHAEAKLVRCVRGGVHDVVVDLRPDSPTLHRWFGTDLTADNGRALFVPKGLAHGFLTLADDSDIYYHMSESYRPDAARGFRWDDPSFAIAWPAAPNSMSVRDRTYPDVRLEELDGVIVDPNAELAAELEVLVRELYPICRSITGNGVRATLSILGQRVPLDVHEVPSGQQVLDWVVPPEWNITAAYVDDSAGRRVIDFARSNLHVLNYSVPIDVTLDLEELRQHLHTVPDRPDVVPYRTSYYSPAWGFCLAHRELEQLEPGEYHAVIESTLEPGSLTYGEVVVPGSTDDEILISSHVCHPSLADDNLSGIAVATALARRLLDGPERPRHTVRFVFAPGTIGAITWLATHEDVVPRIKHGLTLTCLGDDHPFTYKRTVHGGAAIDRAAAHVLATSGVDSEVIDFFPYGYDERQYNSPGFRLAVGSLMRGRHGLFPEYHTSADDLDFVDGHRMAESCYLLSRIVHAVDADRALVNLAPFGEPQLGGRGLYGALGGTTVADSQLAMLWILNLSDGTQSLLDIAERAGIDFEAVLRVASVLEEHGLLARRQEARDSSPT